MTPRVPRTPATRAAPLMPTSHQMPKVTPLMIAAEHGRVATAKILISSGARLDPVALRRLVEDVGATQLLVGTDHPFDLRECVESAMDLIGGRAAEKHLDEATNTHVGTVDDVLRSKEAELLEV